MAGLRLLAVAINSRRMGCVFFHGDKLKDWRSMTKPTKSQADAAGEMQQLINTYRPDVVVTEKFDQNSIADGVVKLKAAIARSAAQNYVLDVNVDRSHDYANKYEEAEAYGDRYIELQSLVPPRRRAFDHEPARLIVFDAIALASKVLQRPSTTLAIALR